MEGLRGPREISPKAPISRGLKAGSSRAGRAQGALIKRGPRELTVQPRSARGPFIGVLAMQGAFAEHVKALEATGARTRLVRTTSDLDGLDGLVLPGGESTTMTMLMERVGLLGPLRDAIEQGLPVLATCAGMIVLARDISDAMAGQEGMGLLDIAVRRNGYGRQVDSFEADLEIDGLGGRLFPGVFIRAPLVESTGNVDVLASYDGHPVAVRQGRILALCFHPELSGDRRLHREFVRMASAS